ncbi:uncharacterized protein [Palaemon carinicauda]|uniref:uncharacterized protein n=1 Tax=Palaemon carinicauda TaxID=392227 RepID=UPI0035B65D0D
MSFCSLHPLWSIKSFSHWRSTPLPHGRVMQGLRIPSVAGASNSSEGEARKKHHWTRERSRRRNSRSRSSSHHGKRRSRFPRRKFRRSRSPGEDWVVIPRSKLLDLTSVPSTSRWRPRDRSPERFTSSHKLEPRKDSASLNSADRRKTAKVPTNNAQRRESPLRSGSLVSPSKVAPQRLEKE